MKITTAESRIMDVLWRATAPMAAEDVVAELADAVEWSDGTVRTLIARLVSKKALATQKDGRRYLYSPIIARADYAHAESRKLLDQLFGGDIEPFVTQFSERQDLDPDQIAKLRRLFERLDRGK